MKCPVCQTEAAGAYCAECGSPLEGATCKACEAPLLAGARYCTQCGEAIHPGAGNLAWYIAGTALVALIVVLLLPTLREEPAGGAGSVSMAGAAPAQLGSPPPLTGTPRQQADRLFNRIMEARAAGDSAQARFFMPMALAAYEQAGELDTDGLYHLSVLQLAAGRTEAARATAEWVLATAPEHLLALAVAGDAARTAGNAEAARGYYERLVQAYEAERGRDLPEYRDHARILPNYLDTARSFLAR